MTELPTWEEISREKDHSGLSEADMPALERFIYNNEPAASSPGFQNAKEFREDLLAAINEEPQGHRTMSDTVPWKQSPLDQWSICGMNHFYIGDELQLFVSMVKDGRCITEKGNDDKYLWNRLWHKAQEEQDIERS